MPLPEGWSATTVGERLIAGPRGRGVVSLELRSSPLPSVAQLEHAVAAAGIDAGASLHEGFVTSRYSLESPSGAHAPGFVAARQVGDRTVWCASLPDATDGEVGLAIELCEGTALEGDAPAMK